jgi:hypothetical protein
MDVKVTIRLLLSNKEDTFTLTGPCVCCGQPSEDVWKYTNTYALERWVAGSKGTAKQGYKDKDGNSARGKIELDLPYCSEHYAQTKRLHNYHNIQSIVAAILGITAIVLYFVGFGWNWVGAAETTREFYFRLCGAPIFVGLGGVALGYFAFKALNASIANLPAFSDYPIDSTYGGGSGLAVTVDGSKVGVAGQDVRHHLNLDFQNAEAAQQFKQTYPGALVVKGNVWLE